MDGFAGKVAVVTGAASGIGRALAMELARSGAKLAISDVDMDGLSRSAERLRDIGASVKVDRLDVTEGARFPTYANEVRDHFGVINQIYNNAGIAFTGNIEMSQIKDMERVMDVNYWGVVHGTKAFLPHLIASGDGHVINISSLWGIFSAPSQSAYNASKFAVRGFTEALRQEVMLAGYPVKVTAVFPAGIQTAIARNATAAEGLDKNELAELYDTRLGRESPDRAALLILNGVRKGKTRLLVGPGAKALDLLVRVTASGYQRILGPVVGRVMPCAPAPYTQAGQA